MAHYPTQGSRRRSSTTYQESRASTLSSGACGEECLDASGKRGSCTGVSKHFHRTIMVDTRSATAASALPLATGFTFHDTRRRIWSRCSSDPVSDLPDLLVPSWLHSSRGGKRPETFAPKRTMPGRTTAERVAVTSCPVRPHVTGAKPEPLPERGTLN